MRSFGPLHEQILVVGWQVVDEERPMGMVGRMIRDCNFENGKKKEFCVSYCSLFKDSGNHLNYFIKINIKKVRNWPISNIEKGIGRPFQKICTWLEMQHFLKLVFDEGE